MMFTFLKSQGIRIGKSLVEDDKLDLARELILRAGKSTPGTQSRIVLPLDVVVSSGMDDEKSAHIVDSNQIPHGEMGLDRIRSVLRVRHYRKRDNCYNVL